MQQTKLEQQFFSKNNINCLRPVVNIIYIIPKRFLICVLCFTLFTNCIFSQQSGNYTRDSADLSNIGELQILPDMTDQFAGTTSLPFRSIKVEDVRFDTSEIGHYSALYNDIVDVGIKNFKINFKNGAGSSLSSYLDNFFKANTSEKDIKVVCFLKKLNVDKRDTLAENQSFQRTFGKISLEAEVFVNSNDTFYAAFKIDTVLTESISTRKKEITEEIKNSLVMPVLKILREKIANIRWENVLQKTAFTKAMVYENYFKNRFNLPVLTQNCKKGVYKTFSEFKYNNPSITDFTIQREKSNTISLQDKNGNFLPTIRLFGYCDGKHWWILWGNYRFPLLRTGNGFGFFVTYQKYSKIFFGIDMDEGKIY